MWTYSKRLLLPRWFQPTNNRLCVQSSNCVQIQKIQSKISSSSNPGLEVRQLKRSHFCWGFDGSPTFSHSCNYSTSTDPAVTLTNLRSRDNVPVIFGLKKEQIALPAGENEELLDLEPIDKVLEQKRRIWASEPTDKYVIPSYNLAPFANDSEVLKKFMQMGVRVHEWDKKDGIPSFILKLDFEKDIAPFIRFMVDNGVEPIDLGRQFTLNPHIFKEDIDNLETRLEYLRSKKFTQENIKRILNINPFWLLFSTTRIDRRLGFFQTTFKLSGEQVRALAVRGPQLITYNLDSVKDVTFTIKDEMGFEPKEVKELLLSHPAIWRTKPTSLWRRFDYLHNTIKFSHEDLCNFPNILMTRETKLRQRIGFLQSIARAQFDPTKPNYISPKGIIDGDDVHFAGTVAKSSVVEYNKYLKTL